MGLPHSGTHPQNLLDGVPKLLGRAPIVFWRRPPQEVGAALKYFGATPQHVWVGIFGWICCSKMVAFLGGVFWAEFLGGNFLPENVARKCCTKIFKRVKSLAPKCCPKFPQNRNINVLPYICFFGRALIFFSTNVLERILGRAFTRDVESLGGVFGRSFGRKFSARKCCPKMLPENAAAGWQPG